MVGFRLVRSVVGSTGRTPVHPGWGVTFVVSERCFEDLSDLTMPLRSGFDHQAASSNSQARRTGLPPRATGPIIRDAQHEGIPDPTDGQHDGTANVRMAPDVYADSKSFENLPGGRWERFLRFSEFVRCEVDCGGGTSSSGSFCATTAATAPRVVPAVAHFDEARGGLLIAFGDRTTSVAGAPDAIAVAIGR
ncbi:hypothetical protein Dimus_003512 [Dionaea muscipula]